MNPTWVRIYLASPTYWQTTSPGARTMPQLCLLLSMVRCAATSLYAIVPGGGLFELAQPVYIYIYLGVMVQWSVRFARAYSSTLFLFCVLRCIHDYVCLASCGDCVC